MRISRAQVEAVLRSYLARHHAPNQRERSTTAPGDKVMLSEDARRVARWVELARALPEVREGEIERLRAELEQGKYQISSEKLADKILDRLLTDIVIEEQLKDE